MQKHQRVIIILLVVVMLFSAFATGLLLIIDSSNKGDTMADQTSQTDPLAEECTASEEALANKGNAVGPWPYKTDNATELVNEDLRTGDGAEAKLNDCIVVHYRLALADGTPIEGNDTFAQGSPFPIKLEVGGLIQGWIEGIPGLKTGGVRRLVIPPELGYGDSANNPSIPPGSTLVFEIELVEVK